MAENDKEPIPAENAEPENVEDIASLQRSTLTPEIASTEADVPPPPIPDKEVVVASPGEPTMSISVNEYEIFSEQFENYLRIGQALLKTLKRPKDIEIFTDLLHKVQSLNKSKILKVKRNNNLFFRYCLKVLKWTSDNQPLKLYELLYPAENTENESRIWMKDNKSYMALKSLGDGTHIIYAAVAEDPSAGWQDGGLNILAKREAN